MVTFMEQWRMIPDDTRESCGSIMFGWPEESESAEVDEACHGGLDMLDCWAMST